LAGFFSALAAAGFAAALACGFAAAFLMTFGRGDGNEVMHLVDHSTDGRTVGVNNRTAVFTQSEPFDDASLCFLFSYETARERYLDHVWTFFVFRFSFLCFFVVSSLREHLFDADASQASGFFECAQSAQSINGRASYV
jgi:hypothetical protein